MMVASETPEKLAKKSKIVASVKPKSSKTQKKVKTATSETWNPSDIVLVSTAGDVPEPQPESQPEPELEPEPEPDWKPQYPILIPEEIPVNPPQKFAAVMGARVVRYDEHTDRYIVLETMTYDDTTSVRYSTESFYTRLEAETAIKQNKLHFGRWYSYS